MTRKLLVVLTFSMVAAAGTALCQINPNLKRGFDGSSPFTVGDVDSVNTYNGNLSIRIPIGGRYPVGGSFSYGLSLIYNSNGIWDYKELDPPLDVTWADLASVFNAGVGWRLSLGELCWPDCSWPGGGMVVSFEYTGPDGGGHTFHRTLHEDEQEDGNDTYWYTRDGSYLRLKIVQRDPNGKPLNAIIEAPDGRVTHFEQAAGDQSGRMRLTKVEDRSGNALNVTYSNDGNTWTLADTQGRSHTITFTTVAGYSVVSGVHLAAFDGNVADYTFNYQEETIARSCFDTRHSPPADPTVPLLVSVTFPDGEVYRMGDATDGPWYYSSNGGVGNGPQGGAKGEDQCEPKSGILYRLKTPLGGEYDWSYGLYSFWVTPGSPDFLKYAMGVSQRGVTADGSTFSTWTYTVPSPPGLEVDPPYRNVSRTVTSPDNDDTVYYFHVNAEPEVSGGIWLGWDYGLPYTRDPAKKDGDLYLSREQYEGSGWNRTLVRKVYLRYAHDKLPGDPNATPPVANPGWWYDTNRRLEEVKTVYVDDGGLYRDAEYSAFDGMGHYRKTTEEATQSWSDVGRETVVGFNPGSGNYVVDAETNAYVTGTGGHSFVPWPSSTAWILGTFTTKDVTEGFEQLHSEYCFDWGAGDKGRLLRRRALRSFGTMRSPEDIITTYTYDGQGNLTTERSYGGDLKSVGTGELCSTSLGELDYQLDKSYQYGVLKTSKHHGQPYYDIDRDIDRNSGRVKRERDSAGLGINMTYDTLGRVTVREPDEGARTELVYSHDPPLVSITYREHGGTEALAAEELAFDGLGRQTAERRKMAGGSWAEKATEYTLMGRLSQVSTWDEVGTPSRGWTVYMDYDRWGRPGRMELPDSKAITLTYAGIRQEQRTVGIRMVKNGGDTLTTITTVRDPFGRVVSVTEPVAGSAVTSAYSYGVAGQLTQAKITTAEGTQTRVFGYDGRGYLLWEQVPEKGVSGGGRINYYDYDTLGHAHRILDGPNDLSYEYDLGERLTSITEKATNRVLETRSYGASNGTLPPYDRRKGKLVTAVRHNYFDGVGSGNDFEVEESYEYRGLGGNVSKRHTTIDNGATVEFEQLFSWNELGALESMEYPRRVGSDDWASDGPRRVLHYRYEAGFLTSIPGYAYGLEYHSNGMIGTMEHATKVITEPGVPLVEHRELDPKGMKRPRRIHTEQADLNWDSGNYAYDGAGNIVTVGPNWYLYDGLGRLKQGTAQLGNGSPSARSYQYDGFGNLTSLDGRAINVNHTNNRLTGSSYDAAGNELSWGTGGLTYSYAYYPTNQIRKITGGSPAVTRVYHYTADGERIGASSTAWIDAGLTYTIRDLEGHVLRRFLEHNGVWKWKEDYIWGPTGLLATVSPREGTKHYVNDHLGSPRLVCDRCAHTLAKHNYYPYGEEATYSQLDRERIKFTGHERDLGLNNQTTDDLDYMHARYFNLHLGRFLSTDPIGGSIGSSQSWNRYSYVLGNPINATDPTGMLTNQYGGPGDMPVNLANAGTGVTAWDAAFVRITWPMFPNVYIPSKAEKFQRAIQDALRAWGVLSEEYGLFSDQWKENFISGKYWGTGLGEDALEEYAATLSDPHASVFSRTSSAAGGFLAALWTPNTYYKTYGTFLGLELFSKIPCVARFLTQIKVGLHRHASGPHDYWHFQINIWRKGVKGSGKVWRFPKERR